jgi:conjugal transfer pilus assembly protein TraV
MTHWLVLLALCLAAAGCAIGQSGYSCSGIPEGVQCKNAREVLEASKGTDGPVTSATVEQNQDDDSHHHANPVSGIVPEETAGAVPLRTPSRVMRIWYAPWENESGDLHVAKILYTEIEPRRWTIGQPVSARPRDITPLEPAQVLPPIPGSAAPRPASSSAASDEPSGTNVPRGTKPATLGGPSNHRNQNHGDFNETSKP